MIDGLVKIVDRLIELVRYREEKSRRVFEKLIEPLFNDLVVIHKDYMSMFEKVRSLLPDSQASQRTRRKKLKEALDYLSEKRLEFEPTRDTLRSIVRRLPAPGQKENKKDAFIRAIVNYLSWSGPLVLLSSVSSNLEVQIRAAVLRSAYPPVELRTKKHTREQARVFLGQDKSPDSPSVEDLGKYTAVLLEEVRRKFGIVAEKYAEIFVKVRNE